MVRRMAFVNSKRIPLGCSIGYLLRPMGYPLEIEWNIPWESHCIVYGIPHRLPSGHHGTSNEFRDSQAFPR